jgi:hypothetical protein
MYFSGIYLEEFEERAKSLNQYGLLPGPRLGQRPSEYETRMIENLSFPSVCTLATEVLSFRFRSFNTGVTYPSDKMVFLVCPQRPVHQSEIELEVKYIPSCK